MKKISNALVIKELHLKTVLPPSGLAKIRLNTNTYGTDKGVHTALASINCRIFPGKFCRTTGSYEFPFYETR